MDLPLALLVLWLFHEYMKEPMAALLPEGARRRLALGSRRFSFWGPARLSLIVVSILIGVGTHLAWDAFTHRRYWLFRHWNYLNQTTHVPILGWIPHYKLFQQISTVGGGLIVLIWIIDWYRRTAPGNSIGTGYFSAKEKGALVVIVPIVALLGAAICTFVENGMAEGFHEVLIDMVVATISLLWLMMLIVSFVWKAREVRGKRVEA